MENTIYPKKMRVIDSKYLITNQYGPVKARVVYFSLFFQGMTLVWRLAAATESPQHDTELPQTRFSTFKTKEQICCQNL